MTVALAPLATSFPPAARRATADETAAAGFAALLAALAAPRALAPATLAPGAAPVEGDEAPEETAALGEAAEPQPTLSPASLAGLVNGAPFSSPPSAADAEVPPDRPADIPRPAPPARHPAAPASAPPRSQPHVAAGAPAPISARPTPGPEAPSLRAAGEPPSSEPAASPAAERAEGAPIVAAQRASRGGFARASDGAPAPARPEARLATTDPAPSGAARDAAAGARVARTPATQPSVAREPARARAREPEPSPAVGAPRAREADAKPLRAAETAPLRAAADAPLREVEPQGLPEAAAATAPRVELAAPVPMPAPSRVAGIDSPAPLAPPERMDLREQVVLLAEQGGGSARLTLRPPELGEVQLVVRVRGRRVVVHVRADELGAQQAVLDHRERLGDALAAKDLRMEEFRLSGTGVGSGDAGASGRRGERGAFAPDPHAVFVPGTARSVPNPSGHAPRPVVASERGIDLRV